MFSGSFNGCTRSLTQLLFKPTFICLITIRIPHILCLLLVSLIFSFVAELLAILKIKNQCNCVVLLYRNFTRLALRFL